MPRSLLQRRLIDVSDRLKRLRAELAVADEQCAFFEAEAEDARLRSLVSETPVADVEARDVRRHADAHLARRAQTCLPRAPSMCRPLIAGSSLAKVDTRWLGTLALELHR